jgi:hypothetical protein
MAIPATTIRRCEHGVYIGVNDDRALYCTYCTPGGPHDQREVILPRSSNNPLGETGRTYANKRAGNGCPNCGSHLWARVNEKRGDAQRICADCGTQFRARLTMHQLALEIEEEAAVNEQF